MQAGLAARWRDRKLQGGTHDYGAVRQALFAYSVCRRRVVAGLALKEIFLILVVVFDLGLLASVIWRWIQVLPTLAADEEDFADDPPQPDMASQREAAEAVRAVIRH